jgi:hypothetical protein
MPDLRTIINARLIRIRGRIIDDWGWVEDDE